MHLSVVKKEKVLTVSMLQLLCVTDPSGWEGRSRENISRQDIIPLSLFVLYDGKCHSIGLYTISKRRRTRILLLE